MGPILTDPTAGRRAWEISRHPDLPHVILDPTDPRCYEPAFDAAARPGLVRPIVDPTDPRAVRM